MTLQSRIEKLEAKFTPPSRELSWIDLMKLADGEVFDNINPSDPIFEIFDEETEDCGS